MPNDMSLQQNLESLKAAIAANSQALRSISPRLAEIQLFPPPGLSDEERDTWMDDNGPQKEDDIRIQVLFKLRDHAIITETEYLKEMRRNRPQKRDGKKITSDGRAIQGFFNNRAIVAQTYQSAMKMLFTQVRELAQADLKTHAECRQTLAVMASTNLKQQDLEQRGRQMDKANGRGTDVRSLLASVDVDLEAEDAP